MLKGMMMKVLKPVKGVMSFECLMVISSGGVKCPGGVRCFFL